MKFINFLSFLKSSKDFIGILLNLFILSFFIIIENDSFISIEDFILSKDFILMFLTYFCLEFFDSIFIPFSKYSPTYYVNLICVIFFKLISLACMVILLKNIYSKNFTFGVEGTLIILIPNVFLTMKRKTQLETKKIKLSLVEINSIKNNSISGTEAKKILQNIIENGYRG